MRRLLLVTYAWPPRGGVGLQRPLAFARHLPRHGWSITVLTTREGPFQTAADPEEMRSVAPEQVLEVPFAEGAVALVVAAVARQARVPDEAITWIRPAIRAGRAALRKQPYSAVLSTSPLPSCHLIARSIAQSEAVPWVADFRDPWTGYHHEHRDPVRAAADDWLERRTIRQARLLTTISGPLREYLRLRHPQRIEVISNGFEPMVSPVLPSSVGPLVLRYQGKLNPHHQDVEPLFRVLAAMRKTGRATPRTIRVEFRLLGRPLDLAVKARTYGITDLVECGPAVPHSESLRLTAEAHAVLVFDWQDDDVIGPAVVPVKLYDALGTRRPVVLVRARASGAARDLIQGANAGFIAENDEQLESALSRLLDRHQRGDDLTIEDSAARHAYEWPTIVGSLSSLLESICGVPQ